MGRGNTKLRIDRDMTMYKSGLNNRRNLFMDEDEDMTEE